MSKWCWKNEANRLPPYRVGASLQFVNNALSAKHNKMRFACNQFKMRSLGWAQIPCDYEHENVQTHRKKTELEVGVMQSHAKKIAGATRSWEKKTGFSLRAFRGTGPWQHLDFRFLASRTTAE